MESFRIIREMGMVDQLTGLLNRNSFQRALERFEKCGDASLSCVYVDADGLHEINNRWGHLFGDRMLQTVAAALKTEFGTETVYRIGGDEFLVFCRDLDEAVLDCRVRKLTDAVEAFSYHISVGVGRRRDTPLVCEMVKRAEAKMYENKRIYHRDKNERRQVREMNRQLEQLLMEKRDLDVFRSVLASKYKGVYIIDLGLDTGRSIYIPPYFEKAIRLAGGKFSAAPLAYAEEMVQAEDRPVFMQLTDYERIASSLRRGEEPELRYRRMDGVELFLRIYRSPDYSERRKKCIWSFEIL